MRNLIAPVALAAGLMLGSAALAATPQAATAESETPTSAAPVVHQKVIGRTVIGAPIVQLSVSQPLSYDGLNPANPADIKVLDRRIHGTAEKECAELRNRSAGSLDATISGGHCVRTAEREARSSLSAATSAAEALQ
jgi:UrcA family protein